MNFINTFLGIVITASLLWSCGSSDEKKTEETGDTTAQQLVSTDTADMLENYSATTQLLFKTSKGIFRGSDFTSLLSSAIKREDSISNIEKTANSLKYNVIFNEIESADITYYYDKDSIITKIQVVVFPKNKESQDTLFSNVSRYLNQKYGVAAEASATKVVWNVLEYKVSVIMQKAGNSKVYDLVLNFNPLQEQPL
jgi:hypothetical protein